MKENRTDELVFEETNEEGGHYHHHHHHHHHRSHHSSAKKNSFAYKLKRFWRKIMKKLLRENGRREMSLFLTIVIIMTLSVPVVIAFLDLVHRFFTQTM